MLGLVFDPRPAQLAVAGTLSRLRPAAALSGLGPLSLRHLPDPETPGPGWLLLQPLHAGICGSDVTQATLQADWDNPLSGLVSFPHVMGHEVVARVLEAPGSDLALGETVVLNPWLGCAARGLEACPACGTGMVPLCAHAGEPIPGVGGTGIHTGNIRGLPGGMGTRMTAHRSQLLRLPEGLEARAAVLADPLAVGLHAAQRGLGGGSGDREAVAVVLGAGTVGLCATAALRHLGCRSVMVSVAWKYQAGLVRSVGARPISAQPLAVLREVADRTAGRVTRPWRGLPWLVSGGAAVVIDAVGSAATAELALAIVRPGGAVVRVGVGRARRHQTTLAYFKEVSVAGSNGYRRGDLDTALKMLGEGAVPWADWLTHRRALSSWRDAFRIAAEPERHDAVKVALDIEAASASSPAGAGGRIR